MISKLLDSRPRLIATLLFNLRCFPLKIALRFPVVLFGKVYTKGCKRGCITFDCKVSPGLVKIGYCALRWRPPYNISSYNNRGKHIVKGKCTIGPGSIVSVGKNGVLTTGDYCWLNANSKIICEKNIILEDRVLCSWDTQIMDSDMHYTLKNGKISRNHNSIFIGAYSWICNRSTIGRGASIPQKSIVASYSLVNGSFSQLGEKLLLAGIPAKVKCSDIQRVANKWGGVTILDKYLNKVFELNDESIIDIDDEKLLEIRNNIVE